MRISDWSSDVCSSDLANIIVGSAFNPDLDGKMRVSVVATALDALAVEELQPQASRFGGFSATPIGAGLGGPRRWSARHDESRVGEERVSTSIYERPPYTHKKKI